METEKTVKGETNREKGNASRAFPPGSQKGAKTVVEENAKR